jgi:hypoxanthine phosphoribosyltransferase
MIQIHDQQFDLYVSHDQILKRVAELADQINKDYKDKNPLFLSILNGAFVFTADLFREVSIPAEVSFIKLKSYRKMETSGKVKELLGLEHNIFGRNIIIVEDIVDTGKTLHHVLEEFKELGTKSIEILTLLYKPEVAKVKFDIKYVGFEISNDFVVGYGLDYDGYGRNLKGIYKVVNQ